MWISFPSCLNIDSSTKTFSPLKTRVLFGCRPFTTSGQLHCHVQEKSDKSSFIWADAPRAVLACHRGQFAISIPEQVEGIPPLLPWDAQILSSWDHELWMQPLFQVITPNTAWTSMKNNWDQSSATSHMWVGQREVSLAQLLDRKCRRTLYVFF